MKIDMIISTLENNFFLFFLLFICAYKACVISPPCPHPLPYHPLRPLPLPKENNFKGMFEFFIITETLSMLCKHYNIELPPLPSSQNLKNPPRILKIFRIGNLLHHMSTKLKIFAILITTPKLSMCLFRRISENYLYSIPGNSF
jgi:hypothetical protein